MSDTRETDQSAFLKRRERYHRIKHDLGAWLDKNSGRMLIVGVLLAVPLLPLGALVLMIWMFLHVAVAVLDILPHIQFSLGGLFLAAVTFQIPIVLFLAAPEANLLASVLITAWVGVVGIRLNNAILASRQKNPD